MFKKSPLCAAVVVALAGSAMAQETAPPAETQETQRIEITGSRIRSVNAEAAAPIQVMTAEEIASSGVTNVQELLLKMPAFGVPSISRTNSNFATAGAGVSTIDLRNLGTARTLVLINGRRVVSGVPGAMAVDLNTIPTHFVERIEMLTGGASAVYGSDAVAGVVNIILKKDFEGFAADIKGGISGEGDDKRVDAGFTYGASTADGRGNVMSFLGYSKQGAVYSADREISAVDQASLGAFITGDPADFFTVVRPFYSSFAPQGRFNGTVTFDRDGNVIPWSTNGTDTLAATGFNRSAYRSIAVPTDRIVLATKGNYEIFDGQSAFFEATYAATKVTSRLEPFPLGAEDIYPSTGGQVPAEFYVNGVIMRNPLVPDAVYDTSTDSDGDGLRDYYFTRRLSEVGTRGNTANRDTFRGVVGFEGDLTSKWSYQAFGAYGFTKEAQTSSGQVNVLNFKYALQGIPDVNDIDGDGNTTEAVCADPNAQAQGCVPINIFGYNTISPEALAYVTAPGMLTTRTTQAILGASVSGEVVDLPAGPLGAAFGFESRREYSVAEFDPLQSAGLNAGNKLPKTEGSFSVSELYGELLLPVFKDEVFAKALNLSASARGSKYSTVGRTVSWTTGADWAINDSFKLRATRSQSTRAPNINELYSPPSQNFPTGIVDPCLGVTATSAEPQAAACRADPGVAANIAANGAFTLNQSDLQGISGYDRGNPDLEEERGRSWTLGLAITPKDMGYLDKFAFTIDYFNIKIADAIVATPRQFILDQCYTGDTSLCGFITRRPTAIGNNSAGSLSFIDSAVTNSGELVTAGVDLGVNYSDRLFDGRFTAGLTYTRLIEGYVTPLPGAERDPFAGEIGAAKNKFTLTAGYKWADLGVNAVATYIGASSLDGAFLESYGAEPGSYGVPAKTYVDVSADYAVAKGVEMYGGIANLFGTKPPLIPSGLPSNVTGTETAADVYDPIGRRFWLGVRMKF